jgi:hypothetical protein
MFTGFLFLVTVKIYQIIPNLRIPIRIPDLYTEFGYPNEAETLTR